MCGRFTLKTPAAQLIEIFDLVDLPELHPRFNIAPTQGVLTIRATSDPQRQREGLMMRWGLVPFWAKDLSIGNTMINARAETVAEKPSFRTPFAKRRCLIPADGIYEWEKLADGKKQPWFIHRKDNQPLAMAGLWESWKPKPSAEPDKKESEEADVILTCTILTTSSNGDLRSLHDRMPVILSPEDWTTWMSSDSSPGQLQSLLVPMQDGSLDRYTVSTLVNRPVTDSPQCMERIASSE